MAIGTSLFLIAVGAILKYAVDASELEEETVTYEEQVGRAVAANPEIEELVGRIEEEQAEQFTMPEEVPSADALARDFQRFLRQRGSGG